MGLDVTAHLANDPIPATSPTKVDAEKTDSRPITGRVDVVATGHAGAMQVGKVGLELIRRETFTGRLMQAAEDEHGVGTHLGCFTERAVLACVGAVCQRIYGAGAQLRQVVVAPIPLQRGNVEMTVADGLPQRTASRARWSGESACDHFADCHAVADDVVNQGLMRGRYDTL